MVNKIIHYSCANCHSSCASCNGSSESQCILCRVARFSLDGKCLTNCPDGYYGDKKRRECMACGVGCSTCSGDTCLTCKAGWTKNKKGQCVTDGSNNCDECEFFSFIALACFKYPLALLLLLVAGCINANDTKEL